MVQSSEEAESLSQRGYGEWDEGEKRLILKPYEALYFAVDEKIRIVNQDGGELDYPFLVGEFRKKDPEVWTRYLIFRDLRDRGYTVQEGFGFGIDFRVYDRGEYEKEIAKYMVFGIKEGVPISIDMIRKLMRRVQGLKRKLILAVVDRRGEIVYYSISQLTL